MTGRIELLTTGNKSGTIKADTGLSVSFDSSAVLEYDVSGLAVDRLVTFDLDRGNGLKAVNVWVQKRHNVLHSEGMRRESFAPPRYMGFVQENSIRAYGFERILPREEKKTFTITTDLALFMKHHVGIQEGPAVCLHLLIAELHAADPAGLPRSQRPLTDEDMVAYLASRPVPKTRPHLKRTPVSADESAPSGKAGWLKSHPRHWILS